jgi:hypothetical protein
MVCERSGRLAEPLRVSYAGDRSGGRDERQAATSLPGRGLVAPAWSSVK